MAHLSLIIYVLVIPIRVSDALCYARNNSECFLFSIRSDSAPSAEVFGSQRVRFRAFSGTKIVKVLWRGERKMGKSLIEWIKFCIFTAEKDESSCFGKRLGKQAERHIGAITSSSATVLNKRPWTVKFRASTFLSHAQIMKMVTGLPLQTCKERAFSVTDTLVTLYSTSFPSSSHFSFIPPFFCKKSVTCVTKK